MSYARLSNEGSDVYVFLASNAERNYLVCCGCGISDTKVWATSTAGMVSHLREHIAAGDRVPSYTIPNLEADDTENFPLREEAS